VPVVSAVAVPLAAPLSVTTAWLPAEGGVMVPVAVKLPTVTAGKTSTILKLNRSVVGAVSLMNTGVPLSAVGVFCSCTQ
jgi:hypothetical protein